MPSRISLGRAEKPALGTPGLTMNLPHTFIAFQFRGTEILNGSHWPEIKICACRCPFWRLEGENLLPHLFQLLPVIIGW